jgi:hypothetical protein
MVGPVYQESKDGAVAFSKFSPVKPLHGTNSSFSRLKPT